jgi:hypothetical protein
MDPMLASCTKPNFHLADPPKKKPARRGDGSGKDGKRDVEQTD